MIDCYVLSPVRSAVLASRFPDSFLPTRELSCDPLDPSEVLGLPPESSFDELCTYLALNSSVEYTFYWRSTTTVDPLHAILTFNSDGSLVFGLSVACPEQVTDASIESSARPWIDRLRKFASDPPAILGSGIPLPPAIWGGEIAPPIRSAFANF